jgi:hypothetical protein
LVALRALLNGAKVCSSNNYGAPNEYFGENATYFNALDEKEILHSIEYGLNNQWNINKKELSRFSDKEVLNKYKDLYLTINTSVNI